MESLIGLFKTECMATTVFHDGPYKTFADIEYATEPVNTRSASAPRSWLRDQSGEGVDAAQPALSWSRATISTCSATWTSPARRSRNMVRCITSVERAASAASRLTVFRRPRLRRGVGARPPVASLLKPVAQHRTVGAGSLASDQHTVEVTAGAATDPVPGVPQAGSGGREAGLVDQCSWGRRRCRTCGWRRGCRPR